MHKNQSSEGQGIGSASNAGPWDSGSSDEFFKYYEKQSQSPAALEGFKRTTDMLLRVAAQAGRQGPLDVLDIGCGAGAQAKYWQERGHRYSGIDINRPLIELAQARALGEGLGAEFHVGSATELPFDDGSRDVCLLPFILEHVAAWEQCIDEAVRVLRPGGVIYLATTSWLCPVQDEFNLPAYAWYPGPLKRHFERRSVTDRPQWVNHAKYPAVNWFSVYGLGSYLRQRRFEVLDRFDLMDAEGRGGLARTAIAIIRAAPPLRLLGHVLTPYSMVVGQKPA